MSKKYVYVKYCYDTGLWDTIKVKNAIGKWITESEYKMIVGINPEDEAAKNN